MNSACLEYVHSASKLSGIALRVSIFQYRGFESHRGHQHLTRNTADHGVFWINVRRQVLLFNIATVVTVVIGVTVLYAALYLLALVAAFWFVVPQVFTGAVGHPPSLRDYFELAWLTCSLAMIGGALGAALGTEDAVREAAYIQRSDAQTERENAMIRPR